MNRTFFFIPFFFFLFTSIQAQFSLFVSDADQQSISVRVPSGSGARHILLLDRDSMRLDSIPLVSCQSGCQVRIENLQPAHIYLLQLYQNQNIQNERWAVSASTSSGTVEVYFTTETDPSVSSGFFPTASSGALLEEAIVKMIDAAHTSIDVMLYNINRRTISNALIAAHQRGVRIRYLTSDNTANVALTNPTPDFPILIGNLGSGLMHNKVFVIDANDPDRAMVITGATNMTTNQIFTDHNNTLFIQDQALARVYEKEVDEMWGGRGSLPNPALSRFGAQKRDDTPHEVYIHGILYEVYFSPSDNTTFQIVNTLNTAQFDCFFNLLLITRSNLANTLINLHNRGVDVRGLVNNRNENGTEFFTLQSNGVFVIHYDASGQLHHKYALVDAGGFGLSPKLITGSHNWSNNAENRNDENTLIIHDEILTNIYLQEFQARWCEVYPGDNCGLATSAQEIDFRSKDTRLHYNANSGDLFVFPNEVHTYQSFMLFDQSGKLLRAGKRLIASQDTIHLGALFAGTYLIRFQDSLGGSFVYKFTVAH